MTYFVLFILSFQTNVVSSGPTNLRPQVRIPSTPSTLFQFVIDLWCEKDENKRKRGRDWPIFLKKQYNFYYKSMWKMSCSQGCEPMTSQTWVVSHNHYTRDPPLAINCFKPSLSIQSLINESTMTMMMRAYRECHLTWKCEGRWVS